jgi:hypothetical protein
MVYLPKKVKKEFVKEIYKEPLVRHLGIDKTREAVAVCYYFPSILWWGEVGRSRNHLICHVYAAPCSWARAWTIVIPVPKISCI